MDELGIDLDALLFSAKSEIEMKFVKALIPKEDQTTKKYIDAFIRPFVNRGIPVMTAIEILKEIGDTCKKEME